MGKWQGNLTPKQLRKRVKRDARKAARLRVKRNVHAIVMIHEGDYLVPIW